ncbi:hypothetical protein HV436_01490 [Bacillus sporothermodurans]|nr:hypothetical protein [Heyndrickxia sporothermodurans]MBL5798536.1 hypothetical protein [Heyndrickxia sporothermodurans]MBL5809454.1 hypothetical protein [Heyndrickxia sporothermodurans]MBL5813088.1 hypothetical protein [Heyndrickxia sporothermodurans]MBL5816512.1 hypothetical protein [Heyndrickxia sporothermodurans]
MIMAWTNFDEAKAKELRTKASKLIQEVEQVNNMKYTKSRKERAEKLRKELGKVDVICGAIERATGKICSNEPAEGSKNGRCARHGGLATGAVTEEGKQRALANLNPKANLIHGLYSRFAMTVEEQSFYEGMMNHYIEELDLDPINILALDRALRNFILNQRKEVAEAGEMLDESESYNDYDTKFMRWMQTLGLDRKFNVSKDHKDNSSGADIALLFMDDDK